MDFYVKISFLFIFFGLHNIYAQSPTDYFELDYAYGSIIEHKANMGHLVTAHPNNISFSWHNTSPNDSQWKSRYNYPDWGMTLTHQDFFNDNLGSLSTLYYTNTYYLRNRNFKNQINLEMGFGLAYNTHPFDMQDNNKNAVLSTSIVYSQFLKLNYTYPNLFHHIGFHAGLLFTHYSNASYKSPNLGINSIFLNAGVNYYLKIPDIQYSKKEEEKLDIQDLHISVSLQGGFHETKAGLGTKEFYYISAAISKKKSHLSGFQAGFDFFDSQADKKYTEFKYYSSGDDDIELTGYRQFGIFVGHHLYFNKLILDSSFGYYLYNPSDAYPNTYEKFILKHPIKTSDFSILLGLKVHLFKAQYASLGLQYNII